MSFFYPFLNTELITIQTSLTFNYGEFAIIKIGVVDLFPDTKKFNCVSIPQPIRDKEVSIFCFQHIRQGNIISVINGGNSYLCPTDDQLAAHMASTSLLFLYLRLAVR